MSVRQPKWTGGQFRIQLQHCQMLTCSNHPSFYACITFCKFSNLQSLGKRYAQLSPLSQLCQRRVEKRHTRTKKSGNFLQIRPILSKTHRAKNTPPVLCKKPVFTALTLCAYTESKRPGIALFSTICGSFLHSIRASNHLSNTRGFRELLFPVLCVCAISCVCNMFVLYVFEPCVCNECVGYVCNMCVLWALYCMCDLCPDRCMYFIFLPRLG